MQQASHQCQSCSRRLASRSTCKRFRASAWRTSKLCSCRQAADLAGLSLAGINQQLLDRQHAIGPMPAVVIALHLLPSHDSAPICCAYDVSEPHSKATHSSLSTDFRLMAASSFACCLQDYGKYGVTNMDDKQKLFRLIKQVSFQVKHATVTSASLWQLINSLPLLLRPR